MRIKYRTPVVFDVDGTISLSGSQLAIIGITNDEVAELFDNYDWILEYNQLDPDVLLSNYKEYGISDPNSTEEWAAFLDTLEVPED